MSRCCRETNRKSTVFWLVKEASRFSTEVCFSICSLRSVNVGRNLQTGNSVKPWDTRSSLISVDTELNC